MWLNAFLEETVFFCGSGITRFLLLLYLLPVNPSHVFMVFSEYFTKYSASRLYCPLSSMGFIVIQPLSQHFFNSCVSMAFSVMWICTAPRSPTSGTQTIFASFPAFLYIRRMFRSSLSTSARSASFVAGRFSFVYSHVMYSDVPS